MWPLSSRPGSLLGVTLTGTGRECGVCCVDECPHMGQDFSRSVPPGGDGMIYPYSHYMEEEEGFGTKPRSRGCAAPTCPSRTKTCPMTLNPPRLHPPDTTCWRCSGSLHPSNRRALSRFWGGPAPLSLQDSSCTPPPGSLLRLLTPTPSTHLLIAWLGPAGFNTESATLCGHCLLDVLSSLDSFTQHLQSTSQRGGRVWEGSQTARLHRKPRWEQAGMQPLRDCRASCHLTLKH